MTFTSFQKKIITVVLAAGLLIGASFLDGEAKAGLIWLAGMLKGGVMISRPGDENTEDV